ncbi:MAG: hypothetical protein HYX27_03755 [Acidobacteria bacterium]|nr:hypothetical protein [Acidobacteriota bacterium]
MPWLNQCVAAEKLDWPLTIACKAKWNGCDLYVVANGPGPRLAYTAVDIATRNAGPFDALISFGLCGALDPTLALNTICTATAVGDGTENWLARPFMNAIPARLLSTDRFIGQPREKADNFRKNFQIVDMEAATVARYAALHNLPFYAAKIVSDTASESFALDFNEYRDTAGRFARGRIALAALIRPFLYAPDLIRMATRGPAASATLGEFLAKSRI